MIALEWMVPARRIALAWRAWGEPSREHEPDTISKQPGVLVGPPGPTGPPGSGASARFDQGPAATWIVTHNFGRVPLIQAFLSDGEQVIADISSTNNVATIVFAAPQSGFVLAT